MKEQFETMPGFDIRNAVRLSADDGTTLEFADETLPPQTDHSQKKTPTDRFIRGKLLGEGGMGQVYTAFDRVLQREIAIKTLIAHARQHTNPRRRFMRESQITAQLSHPSIVPIHSLEVNASNQPTLIMKRIHGQTMEAYISDCQDLQLTGAPLPEKYGLPARIDMLINVCEAISYAHSRGVVHRDLKPSNIMVGEFDEVYVMDWGIAKLIDDDTPFEETISLSGTGVHTKIGALMGSPYYMAPEQARGDNSIVGPAADQYAIGIMLYEMIVLDTVRTGDTLKDLLMEANNGTLPDFSKVNIKVDPALQAIIFTCLNPLIKGRYPSVAALTLELKRFNRGDPIDAYTETLQQQLRRFISNNTTLTLGVVLGIILLFVAAISLNLQSSLKAQENATVEKENTSRLIQIVSSHARSIDQVLGKTQLVVHGLSEVIHLKYNQPRESTGFCTQPKDLFLRPHVESLNRYTPNLISFHEPTCPYPQDVSPDDIAESLRFALDITPTLINAYRGSIPFDMLPTAIDAPDSDHLYHWAYLGLNDGTLVNYPGLSFFPEDYDPRKRPWYATGIEHKTPHFSMPYPDATGTGYLLPCNESIVDSNGNAIGVVGIDISMDTIISIMQQIQLSVQHESFLLNENGAIMFQNSELGDKLAPKLAMKGEIKSLRPFKNDEIVQLVKQNSPNGLVESHDTLNVYSRLTFAPWTLVVSLPSKMLSCESCLIKQPKDKP